ncbi:MAG: DNA mismatch repair protein MutS, partial [Muribaculaceae bacterium]|nr:DNA mismatch repair protein MutS [Muribaculaceae bacterium]
MKQYVEMKRKHPDAVLLFRVGDFYETFSDDAIATSEILGITLTRRANGAAQYVELAGFPHHALDTYLPKLVRAGKRVAICEQLEDPKLTKKLVKRGITELVTPGVSINDNILDRSENNFLAAVHFDRNEVGVAFLDISTGEFLTAQGDSDYVEKLLNNFAPKEVLIERGNRDRLADTFAGKYMTTQLDDWIFTTDAAMERLLKQFETASLKGFGIEGMPQAIIASGSILYYLDQTSHTQTSHINRLMRVEEDRYVRLDRFTVRNLELLAPLGEGGKSLLDIIDYTVSPMGARMLRRWLIFPLKDPTAINRRLDAVEQFLRDSDSRIAITEQLSAIGDLERLISKVAVGRVTPREVVQIKVALSAIEPIKRICMHSAQESLRDIGQQLNPCTPIRDRIEAQIEPDAPALLGKAPVIRRGVSEELDQLRDIAFQGKDYLLRIQQREIAATGIPSLKIGYNNVFGYYIEVTNTHKDKVPTEWIRKQTLVNAERYITQELKEYEEKILTAQERISALEAQLYTDLVGQLCQYVSTIQLNSQLIAQLDCLTSFALAAIDNRYNRPQVDDSMVID